MNSWMQRARDKDTISASVQASGETSPTVFSFGEASSIVDGPRFISMLEVGHNGQYFIPPVNPRNLSRTINVSPHHRSAIALKKNLLVKYFVPHRYLSAETFEKFVLDFMVQGNGYLEEVKNRLGGTYEFVHSLAQNTRVGIEPGQFWWIDDKAMAHEFTTRVCHLRELDPGQEIYGLPEYLSALQSMLLNEAATLFRRRYYINGAHAGFILYVNDAGLTTKDSAKIKEAVESARGIGNFKNLFMHIPKGGDKGVQIMPIASVAAKDEFIDIKSTTRDDVLAAHRTPPQLMGVVPANSGGFGDVEKASEVFFENEIVPLQNRTANAVNRWAGQEVVRFDNPVKPEAGAGA